MRSPNSLSSCRARYSRTVEAGRDRYGSDCWRRVHGSDGHAALVCPMGPPPTVSNDGHAALARVFTISLFTRCTVPLPTPTSVATFSMPFPALRCVLMAFSIFGETLGRPSFPPCALTRSRPASTLPKKTPSGSWLCPWVCCCRSPLGLSAGGYRQHRVRQGRSPRATHSGQVDRWNRPAKCHSDAARHPSASCKMRDADPCLVTEPKSMTLLDATPHPTPLGSVARPSYRPPSRNSSHPICTWRVICPLLSQ